MAPLNRTKILKAVKGAFHEYSNERENFNFGFLARRNIQLQGENVVEYSTEMMIKYFFEQSARLGLHCFLFFSIRRPGLDNGSESDAGPLSLSGREFVGPRCVPVKALVAHLNRGSHKLSQKCMHVGRCTTVGGTAPSQKKKAARRQIRSSFSKKKI